MAGPLSGLRVMDVCQLAVGPWGASLLGQLGAEVIKIEVPDGDPIRNLLPHMEGVGTYYTSVNVSKKNIALDLKNPRHLEIALKIAERSDAFVENFRPGVMERLGLGYEAVSALNPDIVYCSSSGYGARGPRRREGSADGYARSFTGFDSINGPEGARPENFRSKGHIDHTCSAFVTQTLLAGLCARERFGIAQFIETSMMQATTVYQTSRIAEHFAGGHPAPMGSATTNLVPHQAFRTADAYIAVGVNTQEQWRRLCAALDLHGLAEDPRFADNAARVEHRAELVAVLEQAFEGRSSADSLATLEAHGVPCGPFLTFADLWASEHVQANEQIVERDHPWGAVKLGGAPWRFSATPASVVRAPGIDEHRAEVLALIEAEAPRRDGPRADPQPAAAPLDGVTVVELAQGIGAPFAAMQLGDLGADVIKVEPPGGDWTRTIGPPFVGEEGPVFLSLNRNKRGVVLDVEDAAERAALDGLIAGADVLVTDLAPAEAERLGLRYEDLAAANPELIHCNVTPFGERGPLRDKPGGEIVLQAMGDIWRYLGALDEPPLRLGADASAMAAGIFATQGVMAAVIHRARGGSGQKVEVSELGALLAIETQLNAAQSNDSLSGGWHLSAPTDPPEYELSARDLAVNFGFVRDQSGWAVLCERLGVPEEVASDPRWATTLDRTLNGQALIETFEPYTSRHSAADLQTMIEECGGIAVICNDYQSLFEDPQMREYEMVLQVEHPTLGPITTLGLPWGLPKTPASVRRPPPLLGEHNEAVLAGIGEVSHVAGG